MIKFTAGMNDESKNFIDKPPLNATYISSKSFRKFQAIGARIVQKMLWQIFKMQIFSQ